MAGHQDCWGLRSFDAARHWKQISTDIMDSLARLQGLWTDEVDDGMLDPQSSYAITSQKSSALISEFRGGQSSKKYLGCVASSAEQVPFPSTRCFSRPLHWEFRESDERNDGKHASIRTDITRACSVKGAGHVTAAMHETAVTADCRISFR